MNDYSTASENSYFFGDKRWFIIVIFPEWNERQEGKINVIQVKIPACVEYNIFTIYFFKVFLHYEGKNYTLILHQVVTMSKCQDIFFWVKKFQIIGSNYKWCWLMYKKLSQIYVVSNLNDGKKC